MQGTIVFVGMMKKDRKLIIDDKLHEGYVVGCECGTFFLTPRLGVSIECPDCGHTELPAAMLTAWMLEGGKVGLLAAD